MFTFIPDEYYASAMSITVVHDKKIDINLDEVQINMGTFASLLSIPFATMCYLQSQNTNCNGIINTLNFIKRYLVSDRNSVYRDIFAKRDVLPYFADVVRMSRADFMAKYLTMPTDYTIDDLVTGYILKHYNQSTIFSCLGVTYSLNRSEDTTDQIFSCVDDFLNPEKGFGVRNQTYVDEFSDNNESIEDIVPVLSYNPENVDYWGDNDDENKQDICKDLVTYPVAPLSLNAAVETVNLSNMLFSNYMRYIAKKETHERVNEYSQMSYYVDPLFLSQIIVDDDIFDYIVNGMVWKPMIFPHMLVIVLVDKHWWVDKSTSSKFESFERPFRSFVIDSDMGKIRTYYMEMLEILSELFPFGGSNLIEPVLYDTKKPTISFLHEYLEGIKGSEYTVIQRIEKEVLGYIFEEQRFSGKDIGYMGVFPPDFRRRGSSYVFVVGLLHRLFKRPCIKLLVDDPIFRIPYLPILYNVNAFFAADSCILLQGTKFRTDRNEETSIYGYPLSYGAQLYLDFNLCIDLEFAILEYMRINDITYIKDTDLEQLPYYGRFFNMFFNNEVTDETVDFYCVEKVVDNIFVDATSEQRTEGLNMIITHKGIYYMIQAGVLVKMSVAFSNLVRGHILIERNHEILLRINPILRDFVNGATQKLYSVNDKVVNYKNQFGSHVYYFAFDDIVLVNYLGTRLYQGAEKLLDKYSHQWEVYPVTVFFNMWNMKRGVVAKKRFLIDVKYKCTKQVSKVYDILLDDGT